MTQNPEDQLVNADSKSIPPKTFPSVRAMMARIEERCAKLKICCWLTRTRRRSAGPRPGAVEARLGTDGFQFLVLVLPSVSFSFSFSFSNLAWVFEIEDENEIEEIPKISGPTASRQRSHILQPPPSSSRKIHW